MRTICMLLTVLFLGPVVSYADAVHDLLVPSVVINVGKNEAAAGTVVKTDPLIGSFILTNYHVVADTIQPGETPTVTFYGSPKSYRALVMAYDTKTYLALLVVHHRGTAVTLGTAAAVHYLEPAICVGNPYNLHFVTTTGHITGTEQQTIKTHMLRTDCGLAPGNSGGGLYVQKADRWILVGVPQAVYSVETIMDAAPIDKLGFAVPITTVRAFLVKYGIITALSTADATVALNK